MSNENKLKLFEDKSVRTHWDEEQEKWYFSLIDVIAILTEQQDYLTARKYWNKLKERLKKEGNETVTNCHQLKMLAKDGKMRLTDVADTEDIVIELILKYIHYPESYVKELADFGYTKEEVYRFVFSNYLNENNLSKKPLSRLTRDIANELTLLDYFDEIKEG